MRIHFAFGTDYHGRIALDNGAKQILMSYAYRGGRLFERILPTLTKENVLLVDSGAFTLWTKRKQVDLDDYIAFCKQVMSVTPCETWIINLDVIPGSFGQKPTAADRVRSAEQGWANYEKMKAAGLPVIHVFHMYEDFEWLRKLKASADYIGISPANDASVNDRIAWLRNVFSIIKTDVRAHSFGFTVVRVLTAFPFFSADSSSWNVGDRYGITNVYENLKMKVFKKSEGRKLHMNGLDGQRCHDEKGYRTANNIRTILEANKDITRLWKARGIDWGDFPNMKKI